jgi:hypothetical protein
VSQHQCIEWQAFRNANGYGKRRWRGSDMTGAHRVAFCEARGLELADIKGWVIMHTCDNPPCVNPYHLKMGTQLDNIRDRHAKGRTSTVSRNVKENNPNWKGGTS